MIGGDKMKVAKTNREEVRENSLTVPMSKSEKDEVKRMSNEMGVSMSSFARIVIKEFIKKQANNNTL